MASFKKFTGISPSLEAFLLLSVNISLLISSDETKLKVNKSGCVLFEDFSDISKILVHCISIDRFF